MTTPTNKAIKASSNSYTWKNFRCAYDVYTASNSASLALLLIHPIGVGLSRHFWDSFVKAWSSQGQQLPIYNPDLLGCGESEMPHVAYYPTDWAEQLAYFLQQVIKTPVVVIVQGALLPVAIALAQKSPSHLIKGLVLAGPPAWRIITQKSAGESAECTAAFLPESDSGRVGGSGSRFEQAQTRVQWKQRLAWSFFFDSPLGNLFYRYARRRQFLKSFSQRQLFDNASAVDEQWLNMLQQGAVDPNSRYAVFSFLAGFWRQDYSQAIEQLRQPTLVVVGDEASSISRAGKAESPQERLAAYLQHLALGQGKFISGRNVLPYESTNEFVSVVAEFVGQLQTEVK